MRILVDCHVFDGENQGTTTYLKGLYTALIALRPDFDFFMAAQDLGNLEKIFGKKPNIHYLQLPSANKIQRLLFDFPQLIKKHKITYAHFQYVVPPIKHCRYIVTLHDILFMDFPQYFPWTYRLKNKLLFSTAARQSEVVLTVSDYSRERLLQHFKVNAQVTPNAVGPEFFEPYDKTEVVEKMGQRYGIQNYFLYVSRWEPRKNHLLLLQVFHQQQYYKMHDLVFVGNPALSDPDYDHYFSGLPQEVKQKVRSLSGIDFPDLLDLVRGARVCVYPSLAEGFGIPPLESAAAGIPTVCSRATAMSDFDFFGPALFDPNSLSDLDRALGLTLSDSHSESLAQTIQQRYDWQKSAKAFLRAIQ